MNPNYTDRGAINPSNPQNDANPHVMRNFNTFGMSYEHGVTARFGDVTPFFVFESEPKDKVPFSSFHELISDVVPSVQMSKFRMMKDYFSVPFKAIMPNTWDLIYANPTHGDDVPEDANCYFEDVLTIVSMIYSLRKNVTFSASNLANQFTADFRWFFVLESFFDDGSLLSLLGCKLAKFFNSGSSVQTRDWFNFSNSFLDTYKDLIDRQFSLNHSIEIRTSEVTRSLKILESEWNSNKSFHYRRILEFCRDNDDFYFYNVSVTDSDSSTEALWSDLNTLKQSYFVSSAEIPLNISRLVAYQLAYFHFMTNDKVDYIFSADLYRQMMYGFSSKCIVKYFGADDLFFDFNGSKIQYDVFSNRCIASCINDYTFNISQGSVPDYLSSFEDYGYYYLRGLFAIRKSLKFGDYFTGSRPSPLAVGDVTTPVLSGAVSSIDITKNIMMQRFLNAVNKTGRKMSDYLKGIRGANTMPLLTDPKFLARDTVSIGSQEIENTGENQGNIVSIMRSSQSKYAFEVDVEDPAIIIGVISFDVPRVYSRTIDRQFFIKDRFDMFNPYMQNIGDQEIYMAEKGVGGLNPFAYTLRHMEYKQRYSIASGGFVDNLPSYMFIADNIDGEDRVYDNLSPEFIRSHNTELDRFFPSLTGYSLSTYYHFKFKFLNECNPNRNMEYSPTIL